MRKPIWTSTVVRRWRYEACQYSPLHCNNPQCMCADAVASLAGGSWLITGGLGGLGQLFAHWAAANGARHLCLLDTQLGSTPGLLAGAPSGLGAVTILRGDVGAAEDARAALLATGQRRGRALSGVMHAAGVLQVCPRQFMSAVMPSVRVQELLAWS